MFIDCHVHAHRYARPPRGGVESRPTYLEMIERFDALGIERAVLLPTVQPECAWAVQSNEEALEIARETGRYIPFCNVDPRFMTNSAEAPLGDLLRYYRDQGCKGVGEMCANMPFLHPMVQNLFRHTEQVGLPLTFHIAPYIGGYYGLYDDPGLPQLEECLRRFPRLIFLGHSQAFWAEIAPLETPGARNTYPTGPVREEGVLPRLLRRYPNLYGDLSANSGCNALARDEEYAARFLDEFQDRLLFGTDMAHPSTPTPLVDLLQDLRRRGVIGEAVFAKVACENAIRLLGL